MAGPIPFNELERERFRGIAYTGFRALGYALHHCPGPRLGDADGLFSGLWVCGVLIQRLFLALLER